MPRISGIDLPLDKRVDIALRRIYGIGPVNAVKIVNDAKVKFDIKVKDLTEAEIERIVSIIREQYVVEGDLRKNVSQNIRKLMDIGSYRGTRHKRGLPVRGQRTRTNSRTRKGPKKTIGSKS
ncbi:MAG: 30S ribosomal protein S13 [Caldisericia bacterium]|jgi:small subunit ribosomal protein S13|nr:30S ribosomal protein S13 [Caldisericia bacterium]